MSPKRFRGRRSPCPSQARTCGSRLSIASCICSRAWLCRFLRIALRLPSRGSAKRCSCARLRQGSSSRIRHLPTLSPSCFQSSGLRQIPDDEDIGTVTTDVWARSVTVGLSHSFLAPNIPILRPFIAGRRRFLLRVAPHIGMISPIYPQILWWPPELSTTNCFTGGGFGNTIYCMHGALPRAS